MNVLKRAWIPLLIVVAVATAGFTVYRVRGVFGSDNEITRAGSGLANDAEPFNPKRVTYEIFGLVGAVAAINYLDLDAQPQEVKDATLPWSITMTTTAPAANANVVAHATANAWLGKVVCDRLHRGVDANAVESTHFVAINLTRGATQVQTWQFFAIAISYYCPDQTPVLENVAAQGR
jgi:hypothetical protein